MRIGNREIGGDHSVFIIAEAGINHQGDVQLAKKLIDIASFCGADAVKFQKRCAEEILTREGLEAPYESPNAFGKTYGEHRRVLELSEDDYCELKAYADEKDVVLMASAWDAVSADFVDELGVPAFKMASADLTNHLLLEHIAKKGKPVILSTGMASLEDVKAAYATVTKHNDQVAILQCTSTYPSKFEEIHLNVLDTFAEEFPDAVIGYSGHELGIAIPAAAVAKGARILERHFTIDRTMKGSDHAASLEPSGLQKMVRDIRAVEKALGGRVKSLQESELPIQRKLAKSVVTARPIAKGTPISADMLTVKGPGTGIPASHIEQVIGRVAKVDLEGDVVVKEEDLA